MEFSILRLIWICYTYENLALLQIMKSGSKFDLALMNTDSTLATVFNFWPKDLTENVHEIGQMQICKHS